jgi:hypothetical protein
VRRLDLDRRNHRTRRRLGATGKPNNFKEHDTMIATATPESAVDAVPAMVNAALNRLRAEQHRTCRLLADAPKCQRLSALYEQEARLWTLLVQHTAEPVYHRAAVEAQCAARTPGQ